jgi:flagellar assembly protein FliH
MAFAKLVAFDRPLSGAVWPGQPVRTITETESAAKCQAAYHSGVDSARRAADQQLVEMRSDMAQLSSGVLQKLAGMESTLLAQLREALPALALEIARRLLAGYEPPPEVLQGLWQEALEQLYPERDGLELSLNPRDAEFLEELSPEWRSRYPGLKIRPDPTLQPGDTVVRSRFGLTDARQQTKLAALEHALTGR